MIDGMSNAYSCFSDETLPEPIEVNEELFDSDPFSVDIGLESLLDIQFHI